MKHKLQQQEVSLSGKVFSTPLRLRFRRAQDLICQLNVSRLGAKTLPVCAQTQISYIHRNIHKGFPDKYLNFYQKSLLCHLTTKQKTTKYRPS